MGFILIGILSASGGAGSSLAGYMVGNYVNSIDKFDLPSESRSTLAATLINNTGGSSTFSDSGIAGYSVGSFQYGTQSNKISFADDTTSALANLAFAIANTPGLSNSGVAGYTTDMPPSGFDRGQNLLKFAFPTDTRTQINNFLGTQHADSRGPAAGGSNFGVAGYWFGGRNNGGTSYNHIDRINFPAETRTRMGATLGQTRWAVTGLSNQGVASYITGGRYGGSNFFWGEVEKFNFTTESISSLGQIAPAFASRGGFSSSGVAGYIGGGNNEFSATTAAVTRLDFVTDTVSGLPVGLSINRSDASGFGNEGVF